MSDDERLADGVFRDEILVPPTAIDLNGHVNNVVYVQWMQDVAVRHFGSIVRGEVLQAAEAAWVVRSHHIDYLTPSFTGDLLHAYTWVVNLSRVRSLRRYKFVRPSDQKIVIRGETDWVLVSTRTGRPCSIPEEVKKAFTLISDDPVQQP